MKKILPYLVTIIGASCILFFFFVVIPKNTSDKTVNNSPDSKQQTDSLLDGTIKTNPNDSELESADGLITDDIIGDGGKNAKEGKENPINFNFYDITETYTREEMQKIKEIVETKASSYMQTVFTFSEDTPDFSDQLTSLFKTDSLLYTGEERNIYQIFEAIDMKSEYLETDIKLIHIENDEEGVAYNFAGKSTVKYESNREESGTRYIVFTGTIQDTDSGPMFRYFQIFNSYKADENFIMYYEENTGLHVVAWDGEEECQWDFKDPEGFITNYQYDIDKSKNEVEVKEFIS